MNVVISDEILAKAKRNDPEHCPIALAALEALRKVNPDIVKIEVFGGTARMTMSDGSEKQSSVQKSLADAIEYFDRTGEWRGLRNFCLATQTEQDMHEALTGEHIEYGTYDRRNHELGRLVR